MAMGHVLHIGNTSITLQNTCNTDHKLNVRVGNDVYCAPATTTCSNNSLHIDVNGTVYTICDGECGGWVMPEEPIDMSDDPNCNWSQSNSNAYLLSDGHQYFDTGVSIHTGNNIEVIAQVVNGKAARIFGTVGSPGCYFDMTLNNAGSLAVRIGNSGKSYTLTSAEQTSKNTYTTENAPNNKKKYYVNSRDLTNGGKQANSCSSNSTMWVLNNDYVTIDPSLSEGIKLYGIKVWNSSGTLVHEYQPVAQGTTICGHTAQANCMWDKIDKKLYYPAGTGTMGYGVDP